MEEEKEVETPLLPWHHRTGAMEATPEVEDRTEKEVNERRVAEGSNGGDMAEDAGVPAAGTVRDSL